jgi:hypothetical protein
MDTDRRIHLATDGAQIDTEKGMGPCSICADSCTICG